MLLPRFEYRAAKSVREAMSLWNEQPGSRYLAGGTDLIPQMRARRNVARVVDLKRIAGLGEIREVDGGLSIGATAPMAAVCADARVRKRYPILVQCAEEVGAWALRNRATVVGNLCNASPAADTAVAMLALEAEVRVTGPRGERAIPIEQFFLGPGKSALAPGELVTAVVLPSASAGLVGQYLRLSRRKGMDLATVGVLVARAAKGEPGHRVALAAVAPTPLRVGEAEALLDRQAESLKQAAEVAMHSCSPISDLRGSAEYRREMVGVLLTRGLKALS